MDRQVDGDTARTALAITNNCGVQHTHDRIENERKDCARLTRNKPKMHLLNIGQAEVCQQIMT